MDSKQKEIEEAKPSGLCPVCRKPTGGNRKGSMTGWIFQESRCTCKIQQAALEAAGQPIEALVSASLEQGEGSDVGPAISINNRYKIVALIGEGGMGSVYKVWDTALNATFAIKVLRDELSKDPGAIKRFEQEVTAASHLTHPNLVAVYDHGRNDHGAPYLVMDYLEGESLAARLKREHCLDWHQAIDVFIQISEALLHAHAKGVIHRDLKPSNVILIEGENGHDFVKIVDFGIAKILPSMGIEEQNLTQTGEIFGSPLYMSPEQCKGEKLDSRSDVYSLGCLMYEVLAGRLPFTAENPIKTILQHLSDAPPAFSVVAIGLELPEGLETVIDRCLEKSVYDRYQNMETLRTDLERIKEGLLPHPHEKMSAAQALIGREIDGRYRILRVIGAGGWSTVFEAEHLKLKKTIAIKVLHQYLTREDEKLERFRREADAVSKLDHPNIAKVYDSGVLDSGQPYIAMDRYSGRTLSELIKADGPVPEGLAVLIFRQVCDALEAVHANNLVHRDLTPGNIFICDSGPLDASVKLIDFGLAKTVTLESAEQDKLTQTGNTMGTPAYMSPEQCMGQAVDARSDIFSLGCVLYHTLSGEAPFSGATLFECMMKRFHVAATPFAELCPERMISTQLEAIVTKAMEPGIESRYQSASAMGAALEQYEISFQRKHPVKVGLQTAGLKWRRAKVVPNKRVVKAFVAVSLTLFLAGAIVNGGVGSNLLFVVFGPKSKRTADGLTCLAEINRAQGNQYQTEELATSAMAVLTTIARDDIDAGRLAPARQLAYDEASIGDRFGLKPRQTADLFNSLAMAYEQQGEIEKATALFGEYWRRGQYANDPDGMRVQAREILKNAWSLFTRRRYLEAQPFLVAAAAAFGHLPNCDREHTMATDLLEQVSESSTNADPRSLTSQQAAAAFEKADLSNWSPPQTQAGLQQFIKTCLGTRRTPTDIFNLLDTAGRGGKPDGWVCRNDVGAFLKNPQATAELKRLAYSDQQVDRIMQGLKELHDQWNSPVVQEFHALREPDCCIGRWTAVR